MNTTKELGPFEPGAFMRRVLRDFDRVFERPMPYLENWRTKLEEFPWMPELELLKRNNALIARLDLPGVKNEEVKVTVEEGALTIEGERRKENEEKKNEWQTTERTYGRFLRTVPLPEGVDATAVKATFTNGVLEVTVPLPAAAVPVTPHKVPIEGEQPKAVKAA